MVGIKLDIIYMVGVVSTFMSDSPKRYSELMKGIMTWYLRGTRNNGKGFKGGEFVVVGYSKSNTPLLRRTRVCWSQCTHQRMLSM